MCSFLEASMETSGGFCNTLVSMPLKWGVRSFIRSGTSKQADSTAYGWLPRWDVAGWSGRARWPSYSAVAAL